MSFLVRAALPGEYAEAGRVTTEGYHADDLLRRPDGLIDNDYEARLTEADRRAREAELMVAGRWRQGPWHGYVVSAHIAIAGADYTPDRAEFRMLSVPPAGRRRGVGRGLVEACLSLDP